MDVLIWLVLKIEFCRDCVVEALKVDDDVFLAFNAGEFSGDESGGDVVGGVGGKPLPS